MCHSFLIHSSVDGHLDRSHVLWGPEPALDIEQSLPFALWFSLRCQRQRHLPSCWSRGPPSLLLRCVSGLWCKVGRFGGVLLGGRPPSALPLELFTCGCAPLCHLSLCELSDYTDVGPALSPTLTVGVMATGPGVSLMLLSPCHQSRSTEIWF